MWKFSHADSLQRYEFKRNKKCSTFVNFITIAEVHRRKFRSELCHSMHSAKLEKKNGGRRGRGKARGGANSKTWTSSADEVRTVLLRRVKSWQHFPFSEKNFFALRHLCAIETCTMAPPANRVFQITSDTNAAAMPKYGQSDTRHRSKRTLFLEIFPLEPSLGHIVFV